MSLSTSQFYCLSVCLFTRLCLVGGSWRYLIGLKLFNDPWTKLQEGNVFTGVSPQRDDNLWSHVLSRGWVYLVPGPFLGKGMSRGWVLKPRHMGPWGWVLTSPIWDTMGYSQQSSGVYPTGMLYFWVKKFGILATQYGKDNFVTIWRTRVMQGEIQHMRGDFEPPI